MLINPLIDRLRDLRLTGMVKALEELLTATDRQDLTFEDKLSLLVDRESIERENRRLTARLRRAKLRQEAAVEDIDFRRSRGLDRQTILSLACCRWIK